MSVWVTIRYDHMAADLPAASGRFQSLPQWCTDDNLRPYNPLLLISNIPSVPSHPVPLPLPPRETSKPNSEVLTD
ncbi:hypothetical protein FOZG_11400 [Fusarium oxysporum Fo47]|uniref:Uncharacterized protein n=1 Tax=Fusarium oxysporum Fo47 TaxID=660027 RepID=W9JYA8_FUSOX|nr:hypothetical protein FOZG_11400 [Fusarium oxysporum Fo47]